MSAKTVMYPAFAKASAQARPIPIAEPVTNATFSVLVVMLIWFKR